MENTNADTSIILPILKKIPLFSNLDEDIHKEIIQQIVLMYYPKDYIIFKEGETGDALYILKNGTVEIFKEPKEAGDLPKTIAEITAKGFFGEMALISDAPRNASAKAATDVEAFILSKDNFAKLLNTNTALAEQVSAAVVDRTNQNQ